MIDPADYFVHPQALCESLHIGPRTRVWAFAHVLPGAQIGADCNICDHVFIENDVKVGDRVTVKCGVQLWNGVELEDDVFIGPNVTFTNDLFPRSRQPPSTWARTRIEKGASIGANVTILANTTIGQNAMVGAGAVVTRPVPPNSIVVGNPAKIVGYVNAQGGLAPVPRVGTMCCIAPAATVSTAAARPRAMCPICAARFRQASLGATSLLCPSVISWYLTCPRPRPAVSMPTSNAISFYWL